MKKYLFLVVVSVFSVNSFAQERLLTPQKYPAAIVNFVSANFGSLKIVSMEKETKMAKIEYDVRLQNNTKLEFDKNFVLKQIESNQQIPDKLVPVPLLAYVKKNYPGVGVVEWKKRANGQKLELANDIELYFDKNDKFLRAEW